MRKRTGNGLLPNSPKVSKHAMRNLSSGFSAIATTPLRTAGETCLVPSGNWKKDRRRRKACCFSYSHWWSRTNVLTEMKRGFQHLVREESKIWMKTFSGLT